MFGCVPCPNRIVCCAQKDASQEKMLDDQSPQRVSSRASVMSGVIVSNSEIKSHNVFGTGPNTVILPG